MHYKLIYEANDPSIIATINLDDSRENFLISTKSPSPCEYTVNQYTLVGDWKYLHELINQIMRVVENPNDGTVFITEIAMQKILRLLDVNRMLH